jgi:hypothetical protein
MSGIKKTNWISNFRIIGRAKINDNSFKINEISDSGWQYNNMNLGVDCGEQYGIIYSNMMGGFGTDRNTVIYVHGKNDDGTDDFKNQFSVNWNDRLDDEILDTIGDFCFIKVGLETTNEDKIFVQRFLSAYDAIAYIKEHLTNDTIINVQGNIKYNYYNDKVTMQREINSIFLSRAEPSNFKATFTQSILIDHDSVDLKNNIDMDRKRLYIDTKVLDYVKEIHGREIKSQYPLPFRFEYEFEDKETLKKVYDTIFKVKAGTYTQINFMGEFVSTGAVIQATLEDVPDDIKTLIQMRLYTEEEILTKYAINGAVERRYVLTKPIIKMEGEGDHKIPNLQIFKERYNESDFEFNDITLDAVIADSISDDDDMSWLDDLV